MESLQFLNPEDVRQITAEFGSPVYVMDAATLLTRAEEVSAFPNAFGVTARYAMKSCPNAAVLKLLDGACLHIDASSGFEVRRALRAGIAAHKISLSSQEIPADLKDFG